MFISLNSGDCKTFTFDCTLRWQILHAALTLSGLHRVFQVGAFWILCQLNVYQRRVNHLVLSGLWRNTTDSFPGSASLSLSLALYLTRQDPLPVGRRNITTFNAYKVDNLAEKNGQRVPERFHLPSNNVGFQSKTWKCIDVLPSQAILFTIRSASLAHVPMCVLESGCECKTQQYFQTERHNKLTFVLLDTGTKPVQLHCGCTK